MNFSIATLLTQFSEGKFVAPKQLEKKLGCEDEDKSRKLQIVLDALERLGLLTKDRGKYRRNEENEWVEARLRCSSKGFCFAIQDAEDAEDIYIREHQLNHAWNGDRVLVNVLREGSRRRSPEGEVKLILERANSSVLARITEKSEGEGFRAVPLDDRLLCELDLESNGLDLAANRDYLASVAVQRYPLAQLPPVGKVTQILGSDPESASPVDLIRCKHNLPSDLSEAAIATVASLSSAAESDPMQDRLDLRQSFTLAIASDPAHPLDAALSIQSDASGGWQVIVHTVEVASAIPLQSDLDLEAQRQGIDLHLGETALPLLPPAFTQGLGRFVVGEDRRAVSLLIRVDATGVVQDYELQPSLVQLKQVLSPAEATDLLADSKAAGEAVETLKQLQAIADRWRTQRRERGGFELTVTQTTGNDEGVLGVVLRSPAIVGAVQEILIQANRLVTEHLQALELPVLYVGQRSPDLGSIQDLQRLAAGLGLAIEVDENETELNRLALQQLSDATQTSELANLLDHLLLQTFKPSFYSTQPVAHFNLGLETYGHFVAPSQRYADLWVQRVLLALFQQGRDRRSSRSKEGVNIRHSGSHGQINWSVLPPEVQTELETDLKLLAQQLSEAEKRAIEANVDFQGLKKAAAAKACIGQTFAGVIRGVQSYGFFVQIEALQVEGLVHVSSLKDDWYEYRSRQQRLIGRKNRRQFGLGDRVEVEIRNVDYYRQQIDLGVLPLPEVPPVTPDREPMEML
ncbi:ribonuclease R family protein [Synechococcus elongatus]|uniref:ribonuclease R family protein n=1 Tax=Synechococcus elongatus TaxID=32046 RepID=UPI0030D498A2